MEDAWLDVPPVPGGFIVNIADLMTNWTNGLWVSPLHRVGNPPAEFADRRRLSFPFFHRPSPDAMVSPAPTTVSAERPLAFETVQAGAWIREKRAKALKS